MHNSSNRSYIAVRLCLFSDRENPLYYPQCIVHNVEDSRLIDRALSAARRRLLHWTSRWFCLFLSDFNFLDLKERSRHISGHEKQNLRRTKKEDRFLLEVTFKRAILFIANTQAATNAVKKEIWQRMSMLVGQRNAQHRRLEITWGLWTRRPWTTPYVGNYHWRNTCSLAYKASVP